MLMSVKLQEDIMKIWYKLVHMRMINTGQCWLSVPLQEDKLVHIIQAGPFEDDINWSMLMSVQLQEDRLVSKGPDLSITAVKLLIMFLWKLLTPPSHPPTGLGKGKNWETHPTVPAHNWTNADKTNHIIVIASQLTNWTNSWQGFVFRFKGSQD